MDDDYSISGASEMFPLPPVEQIEPIIIEATQDPLLLKDVTQLTHDPEVLRQSQRDPRGGCDL